MRSHLLVLTLMQAAPVFAADEIKPPQSCCTPVNALATAKVDGKRIAITIRLPDVGQKVFLRKITVYTDVKKVVDGKEIIEKLPTEKEVTMMADFVKGFREVKLFGKDLKVQDVTGKTIPIGQLPKLLAEETPVLLNTTGEPVEAFYLATVKEGTLIISVDPKKVFPMPAAPPIGAVPPLPPAK